MKVKKKKVAQVSDRPAQKPMGRWELQPPANTRFVNETGNNVSLYYEVGREEEIYNYLNNQLMHLMRLHKARQNRAMQESVRMEAGRPVSPEIPRRNPASLPTVTDMIKSLNEDRPNTSTEDNENG